MCEEQESAEVVSADPQWVQEEGGASHELSLALVPGQNYRIVVEATLGALKYSWTVDLTVDEAETRRVGLQVPLEAFLDDLATDYVTDLAVKVYGRDAWGYARYVVNAPPAFLAWPDGPFGPPVVWDEPTMRALAPLGVVDPELRATLDDGTVDRVLAPIWAQRTATDRDLAVGG